MKRTETWGTRQTEYKAPGGKARVEYIRFSLLDGECASQKFVEFDNRTNIAAIFKECPKFWRRIEKL